MVAVKKVAERSVENLPGKFHLNHVSCMSESKFNSSNADVDGLRTIEHVIENFESMNFVNKVKIKGEGEK